MWLTTCFFGLLPTIHVVPASPGGQGLRASSSIGFWIELSPRCWVRRAVAISMLGAETYGCRFFFYSGGFFPRGPTLLNKGLVLPEPFGPGKMHRDAVPRAARRGSSNLGTDLSVAIRSADFVFVFFFGFVFSPHSEGLPFFSEIAGSKGWALPQHRENYAVLAHA